MDSNQNQKLVVPLIFIASVASFGAIAFRPFTFICAVISFAALIGALILSLGNVPQRQRTLTFVLASLTFLLMGVGGYLLLNVLFKR